MVTSRHQQHFDVVKEVFNSYIDDEEDIIIVANDGKTVFTSQKLLCFYSKEVSKMLRDLREDNTKESVTIVVDSSSNTILTLLDILKEGIGYSEDKDVIENVLETAQALGIIYIGNINSEKERYDDSLLLNEDSDCISSVVEELDDTVLAFSEDSEYTNYNSEPFENSFVTLSESFLPAEKILSKSSNVKKSEACFSCELCGKLFKSNVKLRIHSLFHSNFKCDECNEGFRMPSLLKRHIKKCHEESNPKKFEPQMKMFSSLTNLKPKSLKSANDKLVTSYCNLNSTKHSGNSSSSNSRPLAWHGPYVSRSLLI